MFRFLLAVSAFVLIALPAHAQFAGVNVANHCIWNSKVFSIGAAFCVQKDLQITCKWDDALKAAAWKEAGETRCTANTSKTPE